MDLMTFIEQYGANGIFCGLFIYLFITTRKESQEREGKLGAQLEKSQELMQESQELLKAFADKYDIIEKKIDDLKTVIDNNQGKGGGGQ